jgi:signal transduction protein with GAF and PtsI domain
MHEKTFAAINKLKDIELELHRLKNALEMANKALDAQRPWVGLTDEEIAAFDWNHAVVDAECVRAIEAKLKEKNT